MCHVDDAIMSHVNLDAVDSMIILLETHFGKMKVTQGNTYKFLGMKSACKEN